MNLKHALQDLGITPEIEGNCRLKPCSEATDLVTVGQDAFGRELRMTAATRDAWILMHAEAARAGIELTVVSGYRSVEYQCALIKRKLDAGQCLEDILQVSAIPGYSEHHSGRALDLHAGDGDPLEENFEEHPAFAWLCEHAVSFGFTMSYPRDNSMGIAYEPWHWCYNEHER